MTSSKTFFLSFSFVEFIKCAVMSLKRIGLSSLELRSRWMRLLSLEPKPKRVSRLEGRRTSARVLEPDKVDALPPGIPYSDSSIFLCFEMGTLNHEAQLTGHELDLLLSSQVQRRRKGHLW